VTRSLSAALIVAAICCCFGPPTSAAAQQPEIQVVVDGLPVASDAAPLVSQGRTLVPLRAAAEALGVDFAWDGATQTVSAWDGRNSVRLCIGSNQAYVDDTPIQVDVAPMLRSGRTMVPARFFSEAFGCTVSWEAGARRVRITSPPRPMRMLAFYALGDRRTSSWTDLFGEAYPDTSEGRTDLVSDVAFGWYSLDEEGNLLTDSRTGWRRPDGWEEALEAARRYGLRTEMVVHVTDKESTISRLLDDRSAATKAISDIVDEAQMYHGVNLDFEGLGREGGEGGGGAAAAAFTAFVEELSERLTAAGRGLTLTLHAPNSSYKGYDYLSLGNIADRIVVMAYDYGPTPEPVDLVVEAVEQAGAVVPPKKLLLGISAASETPESILTKIGIAKRYRLDGVALWRLGLVSEEEWAALRSSVETRE